MNRYLDPNYFETGFDAFGLGGAVIALVALALLFILEDGRSLVRLYIYVFGAIFILGPLLLKPSALSPWWFLVVAVAAITDFWENKVGTKPKGLVAKNSPNVEPVSFKGSTNKGVESASSELEKSSGFGSAHGSQVMSYYSGSTIINCPYCKQAHSVSPREREFHCLKCGAKLAQNS